MFDIFSTREIVTAFYFVLIFLLMLCSKKIRKRFINVVKVACTKKLVIPFIVLILYGGLLVYTFSNIPFWKNVYVKDITIWIVLVGIPVSFKAVSRGTQEHYFRDVLVDNIKLTAIVEFFVGTFTFNIWIELILQPAIVFFVLFQAIPESKEYKNVKKLMDWILTIIGFVILIFTIRAACGMYQEIYAIDTIIAFCVPIIFSLLYIPISYLFALCAKYELVFMRMSFKEPEDRKIIIKHRIAVLRACKLSIKKMHLFEKEHIKNMYTSMNKESFDDIIDNFKINCKLKKE
ncbi:hypothetical protein M2145_002880 [Lachnospiraceae bacterium PF1-21]|uniref:hypothetical protein n=1 Tax=Ohessyouella blattaphilus TaxID=2949333 RepID=UPI003E304EC1